MQDLARFFLSLAGSSSLGAVGGVAGAAVPAPGVGAQLCPSALGGGAVASCAATAAPAVGIDSLAASAAVPGSSGRQQHQEVSRSSRHRRRSSSDGTGHLPVLLKMTEPSLLLPFLDVRLEILLAILAPLRRATAHLVLVLRAGGRGLPLWRSNIAQGLAVICPPLLRVRRTMTGLVPWMLWTSTGMTLSGSVLALIRNFHSMEEPAGVPSA